MTSKTFCVMPFLHLNIKQKGKLSACWRYPDWIGDYTKETLTEAWNNENLRNLRRDILNGDQPIGCRSCWDLEKSGIKSTRQMQNEEYKDIVTEEVVRSQIDEEFRMPENKLTCIEIRFDNVCNLMCRHCSSDYSSKWEVAVKKDDDLKDIMKKYGTYHQWEDPRKLTDKMISEIGEMSDHLDFILIAGGEPLFHDKHYRFLENVSSNAHRLKLSYNSNLTTLQYKGKSIVDLWEKFKYITLRVSIDGYPEIYEYVRTHSELPLVEKNINELHNRLDNIYLSTTCTTSALNITRITDIFEYFNQIGGHIHTSLVQYPEALNPRLLPPALKKHITENWETWHNNAEEILSKNKHPAINFKQQVECAKYYGNNVITYMNSVDDHENSWHKFKEYTSALDKFHGSNILDVYPEFKPYW